MKRIQVFVLTAFLCLTSLGYADAMMQNGGNAGSANGTGMGNGSGSTNGSGTGNGSNMGNGSGMGNGQMMQNNGGFGMMTGMSGAPVVGADGTAYFIAMNPSAKTGRTPTSSSFQSRMIAITTSGQIVSLAFNGMLSRPIINGNALVATASLPNMGNYNVVGSGGTNPVSQQSVLYKIILPLTASSVPSAVTLDGSYASAPVMFNDQFYVVTSDFGNAMMQGSDMFNNIYGKTNFSKLGASESYLYIINPDLTIASKKLIQ